MVSIEMFSDLRRAKFSNIPSLESQIPAHFIKYQNECAGGKAQDQKPQGPGFESQRSTHTQLTQRSDTCEGLHRARNKPDSAAEQTTTSAES